MFDIKLTLKRLSTEACFENDKRDIFQCLILIDMNRRVCIVDCTMKRTTDIKKEKNKKHAENQTPPRL